MDLIYSGFKQHFVCDAKPFIPRIFSGKGTLPQEFNVGTISLDASERSNLKWEVETDYPLILWELDFALTEESVLDEARYLAFELAVIYLSKTLLSRFEKQTFGVSLYQGRYVHAFLDPLKSLASHLPESVRPFVFFDVDEIPDAASYFRIVNQDNLGFLLPVLKGRWVEQYPYALPALGWGHHSSPIGNYSDKPLTCLPERRLEKGVLLPEVGDVPIPEGVFRVIPERLLTYEWEGIDQLLINPASLTANCKRKLEGFKAAGGEVIDYC